ncbi:MAG: DUF2029 domain-containing protein [Bacteroidetes bacterium]|nr:DUF2029 domain-containing protein [Bacteroidota bacterium]
MAKTKSVKPVVDKAVSIETYIDRYFWLVIPLLTIIYFWLSNISLGFYQDDEIAQYLNAVKFKVDPFSILGNNPKPGWKIFLIIPALFDYKAVLIFNSLVAALAVYFTFVMLKEYKVKYAYLGALLLAVQPLFFDLSFRSYSEIFTALLIVLFLILYKREKYLLAGLLVGYIFTIRQEIAVFGLVLFIILLYRKKIIPALAIGVFPLIYDLLGVWKTGDFLFILTEMKSVASLTYNTQGVTHYFKVYIFILGPVSFLLFLEGFFGFFADMKKYRDYIKEYFLFYTLFITVFAVQIYTMWSNGPNPGNWRYLLHISPVAAFFGTVGFNNLSKKEFRKLHLWTTGVIAVITLMFLSKESDGFKLLETNDYTKIFFIAAFLALTLIISAKNSVSYLNKLSVALAVLAIIYLGVDFKPKQLSPENQTVKSVAEYVNGLNKDVNYYSNHSLMQFYLKGYKDHPEKFYPINSKYINDVPKGSILIWENHYGYRPEFNNDIKIETLQSNPDFKILNQFTSVDRRFTAFVIEKIN